MPLALASISVLSICALVGLRISDGPSAAVAGAQIILALAFIALSFADFRAAVAIAILELVLAGGGGHWTEFPGGVTGRVFLDTVVVVRGLVILALASRASRFHLLGRYGLHGLALGIVLPLSWGLLGLERGHTRHDVIADANGYASFTLAIPIALLVAAGDGKWLRRRFFEACALNAILTASLVLVSALGVVSLSTLGPILIDELELAWIVGYMPNGAYRLFLASGIYLQVGLVLTAWQLLMRPRTFALWILWALLWLGIIASYARGLWMGSLLAVGAVLLVGARCWRRPTTIVAISLAALVTAHGVGSLAGFSLADYLFARGATIASTGPGESQSRDVDEDTAGTRSNELKLEQARILWRHIEQRPLVGHGFGAVAREYPNGDSPAYDLSYLNIAFKAGLLGLLVYLSLPLRLLVDAVRVRVGRLTGGVSQRGAAVPLAIVLSVLFVGLTNPYVTAAFGIGALLVTIAWIDRAPGRVRRGARTPASLTRFARVKPPA
jgi:O-antigen ligase/polysaccharide polymerase Wzy-like membrane protein